MFINKLLPNWWCLHSNWKQRGSIKKLSLLFDGSTYLLKIKVYHDLLANILWIHMPTEDTQVTGSPYLLVSYHHCLINSHTGWRILWVNYYHYIIDSLHTCWRHRSISISELPSLSDEFTYWLRIQLCLWITIIIW